MYVPARAGEQQGHYRARITCPDGSRPWIDLDPSPQSPQAEVRARETAAHYSEKFRAEGIVAVPTRHRRLGRPAQPAKAGELTVSDWFAAFAKARDARGLTSTKDDRGRFHKHVEPILGTVAMANVDRAGVERVVRSLDEKISASELSWKTASNVWVLLTKMFSEAQRSKVVELRCRDDNPCTSVAAPDRGARKAKVYLYPSELLQLLEAERVPLRWRRMAAVSVYLGTRAGELDALEWDDIDLDRGIVHVHRAMNRSKKGDTKSTKTGSPRRFRVESELLPLLRTMRAEALPDGGRVFPPLKITGRSNKLRAFLLRANVRRADLHADSKDKTRKALGWHDLRASSATWMAVRGDEPLKIMQRLGHRNFATTMLYVREAEQLREGFGVVFPELPRALFDATPRAKSSRRIVSKSSYDVQVFGTTERETGLEPQAATTIVEENQTEHKSEITPSVGGCGPKLATLGDVGPSGTKQKAPDIPTLAGVVETALADALAKAAQAGQWEIVGRIAGELEARRISRSNGQPAPVTALSVARGKLGSS